MTIQADAHYVEQYKSRMTHVYQSKGFLLKGMLMPEGRLEGKKAHWPIHGTTTARKKQRHVKAQPGNISKGTKSADLQTWETFDYVGKFDMTRQTVNEKEALVQAGAMALGRGADAEIITMFNAVAPAAGSSFLDITAGFDLGKIMLLIGEWMGRNNIPVDGQIFSGVTPTFWQQMMGYKQFSSSDYTGPDFPFRNRTAAKTWNFVNWFQLPLHPDYVPVPAANQGDFFIWHKPAHGWSENFQIDTYFVWDNEYGEWSLRQESEGCAVNLLPEGIARIRAATNPANIVLN